MRPWRYEPTTAVDFLEHIDPRLHASLEVAYAEACARPLDGLPRACTVVLAGHRAAGKSRVGPHVARALGRQFVDLDAALEQQSGRALKDWVQADVAGFRQAERDVFSALPPGLVVAVGGGFLAHNRALAQRHLTTVVPVSYETFVDRLLSDRSRPRLLPDLPLLDELRELYFDREERHRAAKPVPWATFVARAGLPQRPARVVTLPRGVDAVAYAWTARRQGADLLEVRTDLTDPDFDLNAVSRALPLLVAARGPAVPDAWRALATLVDEPLDAAPPSHPRRLTSFHATAPLTVADALARWSAVPPGGLVKHVEPLGEPKDAERLFELQALLAERFGADRVTVLCTGALALPFRAALATSNALDYLATSPEHRSAQGQRLLVDAAREARSFRGDALAQRRQRLGILGTAIDASRSPRLHRQPFDRIDVPADTPLGPLLHALHLHYAGLAVTAPFKRAAADAVTHGALPALNTLVRDGTYWRAENTDLAGARAVLHHLRATEVTVLGGGGVLPPLEAAARELGVRLTVLRRGDPFGAPLRGVVLWTWPASVAPPEGLRFDGAQVAVIAYGEPARRLGAVIRALGGAPRWYGPRWLVAQARAQRAAWAPIPEEGAR